MQKIVIFIFSLFFSISVFANSVMYAADSSVIRSDKNTSSQVVTKLTKFDKLDVITMHYSGWSKVVFNGKTGWIKSDKLTSKAPADKVVKGLNISNKLVKSLKEEITTLKADIKDLGLSKNNEIKSIKSNLNTQILAIKTQLNNEISSLKSANLKLKNSNKSLNKELTSLNDELNSIDTDSTVSLLITLVIGLFIGFVISIFISNSSRRRRDSFNTINRSY